MSKRSAFAIWGSLLRSVPASNLAFIAGAGISVPSGLPTAWAFNKSLAGFLATTARTRAKLESLLTTGYAKSSHTHVRFEQVIQILREKDTDLTILRIFDETEAPTFLHRFLASVLTKGAAVFTTNFDSLIERAYYQCIHVRPVLQLRQIIFESENEYTKNQPVSSFEKYLQLNCPKPAILKLHGSLRIVSKPDLIGLPREEMDGLPSIGATLDRIGRISQDLRLEPNKEETLSKLLQDRIVCIIGYSGSDDFDITPSLARALEHCTGIVWIRHDQIDNRMISGHSAAARLMLPSGLHRVCANMNAVVICGHTATIVQNLFRTHLTPDLPRTFSVSPVEAVLHGYEPYSCMDITTRHLMSARIAEEAMDMAHAKRLYLKSLNLSKTKQESSRSYALFRLGAIERTQCRIDAALAYLRRAARCASKDALLQGRILNVTGSVYMDTGQLQLARHFHQRAWKAAKRANDKILQSAILTNLGLIDRKQAHFNKALRYHTSALELSTASRNRSAMARDYGNIGTVHLRLENYPEALDAYTQAIRFARIVGARDILATVLMNQAIILKHLKRFPEAEQLAQEALGLEKALRRTQGIARYWSLVAGIAYERGNYSDGAKMIRKAIRLQEPIQRKEGLADDWCALGDCLKALHRLKDSRTAYQKSKHFFRILRNSKAVAIVNMKIKELRR